jgi:hypothetical protein
MASEYVMEFIGEEGAMRPDVYVRILLTIIAACLVALTLRGGPLMPGVTAATPTICSGEMKATAAGPMQASLGASYKIQVTCN